MSEIEKLYKNANVKPVCDGLDCFTCTAKCNKGKYPESTAEKQLELIKWLSDTDYYIHNIYKTINTKEYCIENDFYDVQANDFEEALASLINKLWHFLTEEEKQQVKEILSE